MESFALSREFIVRRPGANVQCTPLRKLQMLDAARTLDDLKVPPANRLEKLKSDRAGHYSIRINRQWRVCIVWRSGNAHDVETVDCH